MTSGSGSVWAAQDTSPAEIEAALRDLLHARHAESEAFVPARVLNLVVVIDRDWRGEILNRLDQVGRYHASRTIICAVEPNRKTIDATATMTSEDEAPEPGELAVCHEQVVLDVGPFHLEHLDTIVDPLVVPDLPTLVWSPHGHPEAIDALRAHAQIVLLDSVNEPDSAAAVARAQELREDLYIVDLAWLRSTPWRERVASTFDPPEWRPELDRIVSVTARHRPDSGIAGLLFLGWLCERLGWDPGALLEQGGELHGKAHAHKGDVKLELDPDPTMSAPGLAGITIETASGVSISLDRGPGGLTARRTTRDGHDTAWTVMGASRGEAGILGEGIRQALLRDQRYGPALTRAQAMVG
jgi:glucose-6-phosphate dehydrogenase assembly protein OpcA